MKFAGFKVICRVLIASMLMLQFSLSQAGMVGAEQMLSAATVQADRNVVGAVLNRADVERNPYYYSAYYRKEYSRYYAKAQPPA